MQKPSYLIGDSSTKILFFETQFFWSETGEANGALFMLSSEQKKLIEKKFEGF